MASVASGLAAQQGHAEPAAKCRIAVPANVRLIQGEMSEFYLGLVPSDGFTVSASGPLRVSLVAPEDSGIVFKQSELRRKHASDAQSSAPRFPLLVEGTRVGTSTTHVSARFWLCKSRLCRPQSIEAQLVVQVAEPSQDSK